MDRDTEPCPECAVDQGWTRSQAFDAFFGGRRAALLLPQRAVKRRFVGDRADPTAMATLVCGHTVMA